MVIYAVTTQSPTPLISKGHLQYCSMVVPFCLRLPRVERTQFVLYLGWEELNVAKVSTAQL